MCAIAGYVNWSGEPIDREVLLRMIRIARHRGPDGEGVFIDGCAGLAHARLSIIDLVSGTQPMTSEDGTLWITFNGEIFNYPELREELEQRGHRFSTKSDTEVILHAFEEKGERCVEDFNGQWAFAIWDTRSRLLFLSRDRLGVRPLFYTAAGPTFVFGSEIKSLFQHPAVTREIDLQGLDQAFTFWAPLAPRTSFRDVYEVPPGHSMTVTANSSRLHKYWSLDFPPQGSQPRDVRCYEEELVALLTDATRIRLRSDVPVGAYLSGGLDSTIVTSLVRRETDTPLRTFSIAFDEDEFDESSFQQSAVKSLGTDHAELRCTGDDIARVFPEVVWHAESPLVRTAPAPMFLLSGLVREHGYKAVLTGEGADEMFGGYDVFKEAKIRRFWARRPDSRLRPLLLKRLYPYLPRIQSQSPEYLRAFFGVTSKDCASPFFSHLPRWSLASGLKRFFSDDVRTVLGSYDGQEDLRQTLPSGYDAWDSFEQAQFLEASMLLPGYILSSQGDRMAMAHGVEGRYPFLDHRVVEFSERLPSRLKMRVLEEKALLKHAFRNRIPDEVRRRKKQPYRAPDARSFFRAANGRSSQDYVDDVLSAGTVRDYGLFSDRAVDGLVRKAKAGQAVSMKDNMALNALLSTQLLVKQFLRDRR